MKIIKIEQHNDDLMHLTWIINNICTNACSYCPKDLHNGTNHNYNWDNARNFFLTLFERYNQIHCSIAGGEPSLSPFLPELVRTFYSKGHTIGITSNAAKTIRYWAEIAPYLSYISFSYHPEFADKNFVKKARVASLSTSVTTRVMMHPSFWNHCVEVFESLLLEDSFGVEFVRIIDWGGGSDRYASYYNDKQLLWFEENEKRMIYKNIDPLPKNRLPNLGSNYYFDNGVIESVTNVVSLVNKGLTNFYGYECEIGLKSLFINHQGYVYLGNCNQNGSIGHINNPQNIKWPKKSVICTKHLCHCTSDVSISKWEL